MNVFLKDSLARVLRLAEINTAKDSRVATLHDDYSSNIAAWNLVEDSLISETHIKNRGTLYLPPLSSQDDTRYTAYKSRATYPLFAKHILDSFVGMAMRKDILISGIDNTHQFFKNCDSRGKTIKQYAKELVTQFLKTNRCATLVDYPRVDRSMSVAEAESQGILPRLSFYKAEDIINWKTDVINNEVKLVLVVLREATDTSENEFTTKNEYKYRVLRLRKINNKFIYTQQVYDHKYEPGEEVEIRKNNKTMDTIPIYIHGGIEIKTSVLLPICEQNINWYKVDADYKHGLHYVAIPTPWVSGVNSNDPDRPQTIGAEKIWYLPEDSECGMLEFEGSGLQEVRKGKDEIFQIIVTLSSQILIPSNSLEETATAASIRNATETASLSSVVSDLSLELTNAVAMAADWGRFGGDDIKVEINSDFIPITLSGADVASYVSSVLKSGFSRKTLFHVLKKGEIIPGDTQYEDEIERIKTEQKEEDDREIDKAKRIAEAEATVADQNAAHTAQPKDQKSKSTTVQPKDSKPASGKGINEEN